MKCYVLLAFVALAVLATGAGRAEVPVPKEPATVPSVHPAGQVSSLRRKLTVVLYPIIPEFTEFRYEVKAGFEGSAEGVRVELNLPDLSDGYYDPKSADFIESAKADVYEIDSVFLRDFLARAQLLPPSLHPKPSEFLPNATQAAQPDGIYYGIPHWVCGNLLFYDKSDTPLTGVRTLSDLTRVIGTTHPPGQGLLIDLKGKSTLGEFYLMALTDRYPGAALSHVDTFDSGVEGDLKATGSACDTGMCRDGDYHYAEGFYPAQFAQRQGRALIGYSESLYYLLRESRNACVKGKCRTDTDLAVAPVPLDDKGATQMSWVDLFVIDKKCMGQCLKDAIAFIRFVNSEAFLVQNLTGAPPRYLMPARASVYANAGIQKSSPLYAQLVPILEHAETPAGPGLEQKLRDYGARLDQELPVPK
jgi:thiamine pyridinylase